MHTMTYFIIDKSSWLRGPWHDEPDNFEWEDKETGLLCVARRSPHFGVWLGYVGVTRAHPSYGTPFEDTVFLTLTPHGGLTWSGYIGEQPDNDLWFFGFDCGHFPDYCPALATREPKIGWETFGGVKTYRTLDYAKSECEALAKQLWQIQVDDLAERIKPAQPQPREGQRA